ncbi:hypothetical protein [Pedobacter nyackensis]|uniref:M61 family metallopeptidase n=1 Tax=Pedobacter nyackensis TaxID=475255 RepID=UPI00292F263B|nr:hypothetical protein [Pedobacter nyackensis]
MFSISGLFHKATLIRSVILFLFLSFCTIATVIGQHNHDKKVVAVNIDLVGVSNDKVRVKVRPPRVSKDQLSYRFARIIPGTYAIADYGRFVEDIKAYDASGRSLPIKRTDSNTVLISNAKKLDHLSYLVNDTFDTETGAEVFDAKETVIFSPAGTNIVAGKQFWMNLCGFAGYFEGFGQLPYEIEVSHPADLFGATAKEDLNVSKTKDLFQYERFADMVDNPIMYSEPDTAVFKVNGMEVLLSLYAPGKQISAKTLKPALEKMMIAQKRFLGNINTTKRYAVLAYLTTSTQGDARGIGALEHNNSTTAVFRQTMNARDLISVISHEFFHTVTPLKVHSGEIGNFDFQNPKMSRHLWFYEGVTEYFANLFQVNQGLIDENKFYDLMAAKVKASEQYNDSLSFTEMSRNVLQDTMKREYPNVYQKGALIAMCIDIMIRAHSEGRLGLLWLMDELTKKYGKDRPFDDKTFLSTISNMTFPELGKFLTDHVAGNKPIVYSSYLKRVGLKDTIVSVAEPIVFVANDVLYIDIDQDKKQVIIDLQDNNNNFIQNLGLKNGDVLISLNGSPFVPEDGPASLMLGYGLEEGAPVLLKILRDNKPIEIKGTVKLNYIDGQGFRFEDPAKLMLKNAWLKN